MNKLNHVFQQQLEQLSNHYAHRLEEFGDSAEATQWPSTEAQERRMAQLTQIADLRFAKVLDFGCGTGHLLSFLKKTCSFEGEYVGFDICPKMVETAKQKFPESRFEHKDILAEAVGEKFDFIFINGVFNNKVENNWLLMTSILEKLFPLTEKGLAFNGLSKYVDYLNDEYFYIDPGTVFQFCKEKLSPFVTLKHDYASKPDTVPFEFTILVYSSNIKPRLLLP